MWVILFVLVSINPTNTYLNLLIIGRKLVKIFITGATGYIGGTVAHKLIKAGHQVTGLARDDNKANLLEKQGISPIIGTLDNLELLFDTSQSSDVIINAASTHNAFAIRSILEAIRNTGKTFIHTSGSSIVSDNANGEYSKSIFSENTPYSPVPEKAIWYAIERDMILPAAKEGIRSIIICPSMIYGSGLGVRTHSIQIPLMTKTAKNTGVSKYIGSGKNIWSNLHIDDCADAYLLALEKAKAGSYFYLESGEESLVNLANAISKSLGYTESARAMDFKEAVNLWGAPMSLSLSSNSRLNADKAKIMLEWEPKHSNILNDILREC
jgi:nucleoside-diphosphate-sugar epimerase